MKKKDFSEKKKGISIKTKLICTILPVVGVLLAVMVLFSYAISRKIIEKQSAALLESSVSGQANSIEAWLNENLSAFSIAKHSIEEMSPDDEQLQKILDNYGGFDSDYPEGLYVADASGKLWKPEGSTKSEKNIQNSTWFREGLTRVTMKYGTAYKNEDGVNIVSASAILKDGSDPLRVISADVSLERITVIVNSFVEMEDAEAFLVDSGDKTILANRDTSLISTKLNESSKDPYMAEVAGKLADRNYDSCTLSGNLTVFEEIDGTDWILVSFVPEKVIFADINNLRTEMIVISVAALVILILVTGLCVHIVIRPIKGLTKTIMSMSEGNFAIDVDNKGNDEIGKMSRSVSAFIVSIRGMLREIREISGKVARQSSNTSQVSDDMYHVSEIQADSMDRLNGTVDQLAISISEIAESATTLAMVVSDTKDTSTEVEECMNRTVQVSEKGKQDMQQVSRAMENISQSISNLDEAINKVGKASGEITNIVSVIGNIAEETNLLSLNASIEAARAGEAGRGFAVVASEIGQLAQNSADSVENIVALIEEITDLIKETVRQAQSSMENINESSELIHTAVATFDTIFEDIHNTSDMIHKMMVKVSEVDEVATNVAAISEEQAASTEEIHATSEDMTEQAKNIEQNSKVVLSGAQELSEDAVQLSEYVNRFKVD